MQKTATILVASATQQLKHPSASLSFLNRVDIDFSANESKISKNMSTTEYLGGIVTD